MSAAAAPGWLEGTDLEGRDVVACKIEKITIDCLGLSAVTFWIAKQ